MVLRGALLFLAIGQGVPPYGLPSRPSSPPYLSMPGDEAGPLPATLSLTGAFSDTSTLTPSPALIPYSLQAPFWSDGAEKTRWISLPAGSTIAFAPTGEWSFPPGTVAVKHFELPKNEGDTSVRTRLETRLLVVKPNGSVYGASYKWRPDNTDADLLAAGLSEDHGIAQAGGGSYTKTYYYPNRSECLSCHSPAAGFLLGLTTKQLNGPIRYPSTGVTDNQIRTWSFIGMFDAPPSEAALPSLDRLSRVDDSSASAEHRVRSYLHANCSHCHRPGGLGQGPLDARFETPLAAQGLIDAPVTNTLGIDGARVAAPRDLWRSHVYLRVNATGGGRMPPLARNATDAAAVAAIAEWIESLPGTPALAPPAITPEGGPFGGPVDIALRHPDPQAEIRYSLDGSDPTPSSPLYGGALTLSADTTLTARAFRTGHTKSAASRAMFTFGAALGPNVQAPTITPDGGIFAGVVRVILASDTPGADIRWTTDGSVPTPDSRQYAAPFTLATPAIVRARTFKNGMDPSPVSVAVFLTGPPGGEGGGGGCGALGFEAVIFAGLLALARRFRMRVT